MVKKDIRKLSINELRAGWSAVWNLSPHAHISRGMLERSLIFKTNQLQNQQATKLDECPHLNKLVEAYKKNPKYFDLKRAVLKPGMRLVRHWQGRAYTVVVLAEGFEYRERIYKSLSAIATEITGSRWNGWVFFGLKKKGEGS